MRPSNIGPVCKGPVARRRSLALVLSAAASGQSKRRSSFETDSGKGGSDSAGGRARSAVAGGRRRGDSAVRGGSRSAPSRRPEGLPEGAHEQLVGAGLRQVEAPAELGPEGMKGLDVARDALGQDQDEASLGA